MSDIVDTSILIRHLRGDERATNLLNALFSKRRPLISPITVTEIFIGCRHEQHLRSVRSLLRRFKTVPITASIAEKTAILVQRYPHLFGSGVQRGIADAFILACAWERNATLYTLNTRHFVDAEITEVSFSVPPPAVQTLYGFMKRTSRRTHSA